ncbi:MAG: hypothetical protein ACI4TD_06955 [Phocaeicola sp.]
MRSIIISLCAVWLVSLPLCAQDKEDIWKERKELRKMSREALKEKASKDARKEAKKLKKDGWMAAPGALPIERQLDKSYMMQQEFDDDMFPKFLMGEGMSTAENYDAGKMQATELAKQNLAGQIQTEITALIENNVSNKQLSADEAASVSQTVMGAKNFISQSIGRVITIVELYRTKKNGNKEVLVRIAYNSQMAKEAAKKAVRKDLEEKGEELINQIDKALGW